MQLIEQRSIHNPALLATQIKQQLNIFFDQLKKGYKSTSLSCHMKYIGM
jgi:hypothetical protein